MHDLVAAERAKRVTAGFHNRRRLAMARAEQNSYVSNYGFWAHRFATP
jgi:hypothetical protein